MPADFPAWDRVYASFRRWRDKGLAREFHDRLRQRARRAEGRDVEPTAAIIDSQSVKGAVSVPATSRGYDGGKKTPQALNVSSSCGESGRKGRVFVEQRVVLEALVELPEHPVEEVAPGGGVPVSVVVTAAPVVGLGAGRGPRHARR
jgi:hypothetical protein